MTSRAFDSGKLDVKKSDTKYTVRLVKTSNRQKKVFENSFAVAYPNDKPLSLSSSEKDKWKFDPSFRNNKSDEENTYNYMELHRLRYAGTNTNADLRNYTLEVVTNNNQVRPKEMLLYVGDAFAYNDDPISTSGGKSKFVFNLATATNSDGVVEVANFLKKGEDKGVRNFTLQPRYKDKPEDFGADSIVVSTGPEYYEPTKSDNIQTILASNLANGTIKDIDVDLGAQGVKKYEYKIGSVAKNILSKSNSELKQDIHLVIDGKVNAATNSLNQFLIYREKAKKGDPLNEFTSVGVGFKNKISVTGDSKNPLNLPIISGAELKPWNYASTPELGIFENALLQLFSSFDGSDGPSIAVQGIQFGDAPKRHMGSVQLNSKFQGDIVTQDRWSKNGKATGFEDRLKEVIKADVKQSGIYDWNYGLTKNEVLFQDNQLVAWWGQSDGLESHSPKLTQNKIFYLVGDDAIKVNSRDGKYLETTIHSGPFGSAANISSFGLSNGPVNNNTIEPYIHRTIQYADEYSEFGGTIANRTYFSNEMVDPEGKIPAGISDTTIQNLYIPQMDDNGFQGNQYYRQGIIDTTQNNYTVGFGAPNWGNVVNKYRYNAGGYAFNNYQNYLADYVKDVMGLDPAFKIAFYPNFNEKNDLYQFTFDMEDGYANEATEPFLTSKQFMFQIDRNENVVLLKDSNNNNYRQYIDVKGITINRKKVENALEQDYVAGDAFQQDTASETNELQPDVLTGVASRFSEILSTNFNDNINANDKLVYKGSDDFKTHFVIKDSENDGIINGGTNYALFIARKGEKLADVFESEYSLESIPFQTTGGTKYFVSFDNSAINSFIYSRQSNREYQAILGDLDNKEAVLVKNIGSLAKDTSDKFDSQYLSLMI
ncbi:hypothetical protein [Synechococcus sp. MIT S9510]